MWSLSKKIVLSIQTEPVAEPVPSPTQAVAMVPYKDGLTIPHVNKEICVGCGGCEYVCPARPFRAIYIEGNPVQKEAKPFKESEEHKVEIDDFGF